MSDNQEATLLASWLSGEPGRPVPSGIDRDVMETIYALRPEYAPAPRLRIEEVLDAVMDGPLLDPAIGRALEGWLNSPPGTPPPQNLPIGIVEATYALRPDLAPALQFGIDDVLGELKEGPLAETPVVHLNTRRQWWASPALGAVAVAAIALFFVGPLAHKAEQPTPTASRTAAPEAEAIAVEAVAIDVDFVGSEQTVAAKDAPEPTARFITKAPESAPAALDMPPPPPAATVAPPTEQRAAVPPIPTLTDSPNEKARSRRGARSAQDARSAFETADEASAEANITAPQVASTDSARPLRLNPQVATFETQADTAITEGDFNRALDSINAALALSGLNRFETARLWRTKARILTQLGRETDAQHARQTAARLDPTR